MKKRFVAVVICILTLFLFVGSAKASENLTIYVDDGNADYLAELVVSGEKDASSLIALLAEHGMIPVGTVVNRFEVLNQEDTVIGILDLSKEYEKAVSHTGTAGETMYIYSVVNTLIKNLELDKVRLTCDGDIISTGHAIYEDDFTFYDHIIEASEWNDNMVNAQSTTEDGLGESSITVIDESSTKSEDSTDDMEDLPSQGEQVKEDASNILGTEVKPESKASQLTSTTSKNTDAAKTTQQHRILIVAIMVFAMAALVFCIFIRVGKRRKI